MNTASHESGPGRVDPGEATKITAQVTFFAVSVALVLVVTKLVAWWVSGSVAMLASLADSLLDLVASVVTAIAVRYAGKPADNEHRYGHGKAEAFASLAQAMLVGLSAGFLMHESGWRLYEPQPIQASQLAIGVMVFASLMTAGLVWVQTLAVSRTQSLAVQGDRAHYVSDLAANGVVIVGLVLAGPLGLGWADPIVGFAVALWLCWTALEVGLNAYQNLMDKELPDEDRAQIAALACDDPRIIGVHRLRTRASGPFIHIQMHMELESDLSLKTAHDIMIEAETRILKAFPAADVLIHPDPEGANIAHGSVYFRDAR